MKKAICLLVSSLFLLTSCGGNAAGGDTSKDSSEQESSASSSESSSGTESSSSEPAKVLTGISAKFVDGLQVKYESLNLPYGVNIIKDYTFEVLAEYDDATTSELAKTDYEMVVDNQTGINESPNLTGDYTFTFIYGIFHTTLSATIYDDEEFTIDLDHAKVTYGTYPQDYVSDADLITALNGLGAAEDTPVTYESNTYVKVRANTYSSSIKFHDETSITNGAYYWFKYQPISWRILSTGEKYLLLAEQVLDTHCYYRDQNQRQIDGNTVTANNYEHSDIRPWLNETFLPAAFGDKTRHMVYTTVKNDASTTNNGSNPYACNDTQDKVFLPSYQDMINTAYGFSSNASDMNDASHRVINGSDYAKVRGLMAGGNTEYNKVAYLTRSPYHDYGGKYANYCQYNGAMSFVGVNGTQMGVLPMITVVTY